MTAKGHITLQKYCFYVSWQNLDLNFQPCQLQNSNKINRRFVRPKRRFGKMKRRLVFLKRRFDFLRIFVLIGRVESCGFESKAMVCRLWLRHKEKNNRQDCPADCFFFVLRCVIRLFCPDILLGLLPSILLRLSSLLL